jgi:hypothetical protein
MSEPRIPYDDSASSLTHPGDARDFFPLRGETSDAGLCAEMARLAYVKFERPDLKRRLEDEFLPRVDFNSNAYMDVGGTQVLVVDGQTRDSHAVRVIAFRGTEPDDLRDILDDLKFLPKHWAAGGTVHGGFAGAFDRVKESVLAAIDGARPDGKVFVTGHSLGAALATLTASLASQVRLVTFGSPRVGDSVFTSLIGSDRHDRFVDYLDVVTRIPPDHALGFVHGNRGHFIDRDGTVQRNLSDQDIVERQRAAGCVNWTTVEFLARVKAAATPGDRIPVRDLTDHAPINYTSGVLGVRA